MYTNLFGLNTVILRYFNVYGERQPLKGQYAPVVGIFQRQVAAGEPMTIVGDGGQKRDFTYVKDVANANFLAMTSVNSEIFGETFNVGTGTNISVLELASLIGDEVVHIPERLGESRATLADARKINSMMGWKPTISIQGWLANED
jgi:UDP-glucose 4-epimerase